MDLNWLSRFLDCKLEKGTVNTPGAYHRKSTDQRILLLVTKLNATVEVGLAAAGAKEGESATVIGELQRSFLLRRKCCYVANVRQSFFAKAVSSRLQASC